MSFLLPLLLVLVLAACVAFLYTDGMWSNALRWINVTTAALLATNFWEPLARFLENNISQAFSYFWDFLALWGTFCVVLLILTLITGFASKVKVKFLGLADRIGGLVFSLLVGWTMVCFTTMSLHTAPLAKNFLFGGFNPEKRMLLGIAAPDRQWLSFMERASAGGFSHWGEPRVFDPGHQFIPKYGERRAAFQAHLESSSGGMRDVLVSPSDVSNR